MAKPTAEQYYRAFKKSYTNALPINFLLPYLFEAGVISGNLMQKLNSIPVCSDKVICLLNEMEPGLRVGIINQFESFICVMEKYDDVVVNKLAENIRLVLSGHGAEEESLAAYLLSALPGGCILCMTILVLFNLMFPCVRGGEIMMPQLTINVYIMV